MSATVKIRVEADGTKQVAAEARGLGRALDRLKSKSFGANVAPAIGSLRAYGLAADGLSRRLSRMAGTAARFGAVGLGAGAVALGAGLASSVRAAVEFEAAMSRVGAVAGASRAEMKLLEQQAIDLGASSVFTAQEAAEAQAELAKGGLAASEILGGALPAALALAAAGDVALADAASFTVNAMKLFNMEGSESIKVADAFAVAANISTADVHHFGQALVQGGSAAKLAGYDFTDTMVVLTAMAEAGVKGSDAGTSMKAAFTQLAAPTAKQAQLAKELGINWLDANGALKDAEGLSVELTRALEGKTKADQLAILTTLAGTDGQRALAALYQQGADNLAGFRKELIKEGYAAEVAEKKLDNLKGRIEQLNGALDSIKINVGRATIPALSRLADHASREWAPRMVRASEQIEEAWNTAGMSVGEKWEATWDAISATGLPDALKEGLYTGLSAIGTEGPKLIMKGLAEAPWPAKGVLATILLAKLAPALRAAGVLLAGTKGGPALPGGLPSTGGLPGRGGVVPVMVMNPGFAGAMVPGAGGRRVPNVGGVPAGGVLYPPGRPGSPTTVPPVIVPPTPGRGAMLSGLGGRLVPAALLGLTAGSLTSAGAGAAGVPGGGLAGQVVGGAAFGATIGSVAGPKGALVGALAGGAFAGLAAGFRKFAGSSEADRIGERVQKRTEALAAGLDRSSRAPIERAVRDVERAQDAIDIARRRQRSGIGLGQAPGVRITAEARQPTAPSPALLRNKAEASRREGLAVAKEFTRGLNEGAKFINEADLFRATEKRFDNLGPAGQQSAARTMATFARELEASGRIPEGAADRFTKRLADKYASLGPMAGRSAAEVGKNFRLDRELRGSFRGVDKVFGDLKATFSDAPKFAKTNMDNVARNTDRAMTFLVRKAGSADKGVAKAAKSQIRSMLDAQDRVASANAAMGRSFDAPSDASIQAAAAISGAAGRAASAWAGVASAIANQMASISGQVAAFAARMAATVIPAPRIARLALNVAGRAHGGYVGYAGGGFTGVTSGPYRGVDDRLVPLAGNEAVLNPAQQAMVPGGRSTLTRIFRATGGALPGQSPAGYSGGGFVNTEEGKALVKLLRAAGVTEAEKLALAINRGLTGDPSSGVADITGSGPTVANRASLKARRRAIKAGLSPEEIALEREAAYDLAEAKVLKRDLTKLRAAHKRVNARHRALSKSLAAVKGKGAKKDAARGRIGAALRELGRQRRSLDEAIVGVELRLAEIDDVVPAQNREGARPAEEGGSVSEGLFGGLDATLTSAGRDDGLQDKQTAVASEAGSRARGVTNPEKITAEAERAVLARQRGEVESLAAEVKRTHTAAAARRDELWRQWGGTYRSLQKTPRSKPRQRASFLAQIARIRDEIDLIDGQMDGLLAQHADLQARANELGFDVGQLDIAIAALPDVEPVESGSVATPGATGVDNDSGANEAALAAARADAQSSGALLRTLFGPGDIGAGDLFAGGAAGGRSVGLGAVNIAVQTLMPSDPNVLIGIAKGVTAALTHQGARQTKTTVTGM